MLSGTFFSAVSQILLKQSANIRYENRIREYLNFRVILSYTIYVFVLLLSHFTLKEKITKGKIMGNLIIIAGILIYTL